MLYTARPKVVVRLLTLRCDKQRRRCDVTRSLPVKGDRARDVFQIFPNEDPLKKITTLSISGCFTSSISSREEDASVLLSCCAFGSRSLFVEAKRSAKQGGSVFTPSPCFKIPTPCPGHLGTYAEHKQNKRKFNLTA